jgi:hypothetical protein
MRLKRALQVGVLAGLVMRPAMAAPPAISAAETTVRLGLVAGYGAYMTDSVKQGAGSGPLLGVTSGISTLTPGALAAYGWPDLYAGVSYDFSAGFLHDQRGAGDALPGNGGSSYNNAIVRLGLGRPVSAHAELIPYIAGGYQNFNFAPHDAGAQGLFSQTGLAGIGMKLDMAGTRLWVISADAEGFALVGAANGGAAAMSGGFGTSAEERISLGADYRLNGAWHAFAGLGVTHYGEKAQMPAGSGGGFASGTGVQVNSMFGVSYGF